MKKILLLAIASCFAISSFSQGEINTMTNLNISFNQPLANFGESVYNDVSENRYAFLRNNKKDFRNIGGGITFGGNFYIHPTEFFEGFKLGIVADFIDLSANYITYTDTTTINISGDEKPQDLVDCADLIVRYSLNVGVVATFSPADKFFIDLNFKVRPTIANHWFKFPEWDVDGIISSENPVPPFPTATEEQLNDNPVRSKQMKEANGFGYGTKFSAGIDIRYGKLLIGAEYVWGNVNFHYDKDYVNAADHNQLRINDSYLKAKLGIFFAE